MSSETFLAQQIVPRARIILIMYCGTPGEGLRVTIELFKSECSIAVP